MAPAVWSLLTWLPYDRKSGVFDHFSWNLGSTLQANLQANCNRLFSYGKPMYWIVVQAAHPITKQMPFQRRFLPVHDMTDYVCQNLDTLLMWGMQRQAYTRKGFPSFLPPENDPITQHDQIPKLMQAFF